MLKVGLSTCGNKPLDVNNLRLMKSAGIDAIELSKADYNNFNFNEFKKNCDIADIKIWSMHLPYAPFETIDPTSSDATIKTHTFDLFCSLIEKGSLIGINKFVVHPSKEPIKDEERVVRLKNSAEFLSDLADFAEKYSAVICVEDLPRSCIGNCSDELLFILSKNDKLRVCFDTNHLLSEGILDFIEKIGDKIVTVHVSDFDFVNERHWMPGEGDIDWQSLYNKLLSKGYNGVWMYELTLTPPKSITRRDLCFDDIYTNAKEIFDGKKPTPFGKRIENLGFWA